ncbi:MAG: GntR family transcriptional regulator [Spirochaetales bacterium]|nr:GntR family transcriptional regulator [Spirochaetales bacterium]
MNIILSNASDEPIYAQIAHQIKTLVLKGEIEALAPLPSIRTLARELEISVITTKRAYDELEHEGFIETVPGKGSYVAAQNKEILREARYKIVEGKMGEAVSAALSIGLTYKDLESLLKILYEER